MATTATQQIALDNALVSPEKQVEISKCNMRINSEKTQKEPTYQVVLDTLALTTCYPAFLITIDKKRFSIDMEVFKEILQICLRLLDQEFDEPPSEEEILDSFIKDLPHWLVGDISLDKIRLSRAQILWGMYYKKNIDFVALLWEDYAFQIDNKDVKKHEKMYYPRFIKAIIHQFLSKDKSISMRNKIYGTLPPIRPILHSQLYCTPKPKKGLYKKNNDLKNPTTKDIPFISLKKRSLKKKYAPAKKYVSSKKPSRKQSTGVQIRDTPGVSVSKKKAPAITDKSKGIDLMSGATLLEDAQMRKFLNGAKGKFILLNQVAQGESGDDDDSNDDDDSDIVCNKKSMKKSVHTLENYESSDDENEHVNKEEYDHIDDELYKDVNVKLKDVEHGEEGKGGGQED
ncbi:hypothetical protein Tco_0238157 [Tanacetum coccineum]